MPRKIRDFKDEYQSYHASPEQKKNRATRNSARATAVAEGRVKKGDNLDVDHKKPISKGGGNGKGNTRVTSVKANRSFARNSRGGIK